MSFKGYFINYPSNNELKIIDSLFSALKSNRVQNFKRYILDIPGISSFERINFYFITRYSMSIVDAINVFNEKDRAEIESACLMVSGLSKFKE